jgi:hypothetical protein
MNWVAAAIGQRHKSKNTQRWRGDIYHSNDEENRGYRGWPRMFSHEVNWFIRAYPRYPRLGFF